ncbi:MAG: cell wall anchor protein [Longicatena sp.]
MNRSYRTLKASFIILVVSLLMIPFSLAKVHAASYEVVFKSGAHGTINGNKNETHKLNAGDIFPDEPVVQAEAGYAFKGWDKALPSVGSTVSGKQVFVARYSVLVSGVQYTVHYVDENKVAIATPKTIVAEENSTVNERAKNVAGYQYQEATKDLTITKDLKDVYFTYTLTNPNEVIKYVETTEYETINQVVNGENAANNNNATTNNPTEAPGTTPDNEPVQDNETPKADGGKDKVEDNQTPKAKGTSNNMLLIGGGIAGLALLVGCILFFLKKRKVTEK